MSARTRLNYYRRIFRAYLTDDQSHLTFWHDVPAENPDARSDRLGPYHMLFTGKADYPGEYDANGVPQLNYHGTIGLQYNPIAIAQYGLGNYNLWHSTGEERRRAAFLSVADWLVRSLEQNPHGLWVWNHHFDWDYRTTLKAPWYSGLAQGQGISVLVRAYQETQRQEYLDAARRAFAPMLVAVSDGGVVFWDEQGNPWLEEYIVDPPTHILNGFMWALWGVHDYWLCTREPAARQLFDSCSETLARNLPTFDVGYWSLYEHSGTRMKMLASGFYHSLHIVQLRVMSRLTGNQIFSAYADRWSAYAAKTLNRKLAYAYKAVFKVVYY